MARQSKNPKSEGPKQANLFDQETGSGTVGQTYVIDDAVRDELLLTLMSLRAVRGIGFMTLCSVFDSGILQSLFSLDTKKIDSTLSLLQAKQRLELIKALSTGKERLLEAGRKSVEQIKSRGIHFVVKGHSDYPESLLKLPEPPRWLFIQGNVSVLKSKSIVAIVGTRDATIDGQRLAYLCASQLAKKNIVILSGLAKGIDEKAHLGAIDYFGQSIAILGFGLDDSGDPQGNKTWKKILDTDGAIVSEYCFPY